MGYYLRYISDDPQRITLTMLEEGLKTSDGLHPVQQAWSEMICGQVEINTAGDDIFEDDIGELIAWVAGGDSPAEQQIVAVLKNAQTMIAVEAEWAGNESEATLAKIDPVWDWLFDHFHGLLQADNEGFYDRNGLILPLDLKL